MKIPSWKLLALKALILISNWVDRALYKLRPETKTETLDMYQLGILKYVGENNQSSLRMIGRIGSPEKIKKDAVKLKGQLIFAKSLRQLRDEIIFSEELETT